MVTEFRTIDYFAENRPKWFLDKKLSGGGIVMYYGAHAMDKLFYILQCRPRKIYSVLDNIKNNATIEGHAQILAEFECGVSATVTFSGYINTGYESVYYFIEGALKIVGTHQLFKQTGNVWVSLELPETPGAIPAQLDEFCKLIRGKNNEIPTAQYGADVIATIEQIYKEQK